MELGKVPSSTEKGKDRKNSKEEEGDRFGRDKKGKQKEKKQARKDGFSVDQRKAASAVFPAGAPYLIRAAWDVKGREDETGLASERGSFNTVFQRERHNFSMQQLTAQHRKSRFSFFKFFYWEDNVSP